MELRGLTPVDTMYEWIGHTIGHRIGQYLLYETWIIVGIICLAAGLRLLFDGMKKESYRDLGIYLVYLVVISFLIWPIDVSVAGPGSARTSIYGSVDGRFVGKSGAESGVFWDPQDGNRNSQDYWAREDTLKIKVPRVLAYATAWIDAFQHTLVGEVSSTLGNTTFEWLRVAAINNKARLLDPNLRQDLDAYMKYCFWPAMVDSVDENPGGIDPWDHVPLAGLPVDGYLTAKYASDPVLYTVPAEKTATHRMSRRNPGYRRLSVDCTEFHDFLNLAIGQHLNSEAFHIQAHHTYAELSKQLGNKTLGGDEYRNFYRKRLIYNEVYLAGDSEASMFRDALPEYRLFRPDSGPLGFTFDYDYMDVEGRPSGNVFERVGWALKNLPGMISGIGSAISEYWNQKAIGPASYYHTSAIGPFIYGLVQMFLLMFFPIVALYSFWPGKWTAIVNYLHIYASVKLWPIGWAILSGLVSLRVHFDPQDPQGFQGTFGGAGLLPALGLMVAGVPVISFFLFTLVVRMSAGPLGSLMGGSRQGNALGMSIMVGTVMGRMVPSGGGGSTGGAGGAAAAAAGGASGAGGSGGSDRRAGAQGTCDTCTGSSNS